VVPSRAWSSSLVHACPLLYERRWIGLTPEEMARVREDLEAFAAELFDGFFRADQRRWGQAYVRGLLLDGRRKSVEPMAARLGEDGNRQALAHFMTTSPWDAAHVRARTAWRLQEAIGPEALIVDDTGFLKDGDASACVSRQYAGTAGKVTKCQVGVSLHLAGSCLGRGELAAVPVRVRGSGLSGGGPGQGRPPQPLRHSRRSGACGEVAARPGHDRRDPVVGHRHSPGRRGRRLRGCRRFPPRTGRTQPALRGGHFLPPHRPSSRRPARPARLRGHRPATGNAVPRGCADHEAGGCRRKCRTCRRGCRRGARAWCRRPTTPGSCWTRAHGWRPPRPWGCGRHSRATTTPRRPRCRTRCHRTHPGRCHRRPGWTTGSGRSSRPPSRRTAWSCPRRP
jgi:hypothetical protein